METTQATVRLPPSTGLLRRPQRLKTPQWAKMSKNGPRSGSGDADCNEDHENMMECSDWSTENGCSGEEKSEE
jgi:hypothetical protein